jgi:hypothetical protein
MTPFLEVLTRHHTGRPSLLQRCEESLAALESDDWVHTLLVDDKGRGVPWANQQLRHIAPKLVGEWIWILDDDDLCILPSLIDQLRSVVTPFTELVMVRGDFTAHGVGIVPSRSWGRTPVLGDVGMSCFVVRRDCYQRFAHAFPYAPAGDYAFISTVYAGLEPEQMVWLDVVASKDMRWGRGQPE